MNDIVCEIVINIKNNIVNNSSDENLLDKYFQISCVLYTTEKLCLKPNGLLINLLHYAETIISDVELGFLNIRFVSVDSL